MPNTSLPIELTRMTKRNWKDGNRPTGTPQQVALRCRIVLGALAGEENVAIADRLGGQSAHGAAVAQACTGAGH